MRNHLYLSILLIMILAPGCMRQDASLPYMSSVDIIECREQYAAEVMYFYTRNWKAFREKALDAGVISGYRFLRTATDSNGIFQLILITEYPDSLTFSQREQNFAPIMRAISPNGPQMLNDVPRQEILQYLNGYDARTLHSASRSK